MLRSRSASSGSGSRSRSAGNDSWNGRPVNSSRISRVLPALRVPTSSFITRAAACAAGWWWICPRATARGRIGIHGHDQRVPFPARRLEQRDVPGVQEIEDAVREDDRALGPSPGRGGLGRADLRGGVQSGCVVLGWSEKAWLKNGKETHSL